MKVGHLNANRLRSHFSLIETTCLDNDLDVFAITETFLIPEHSDNDTAIDGYIFFRNDRIGKEGGGVGVFVKDSFTVKILETSDQRYSKKPEFMILELRNGNNKILFSVVYRPPHAAFPSEFLESFSKHLPLYSDLIITGDFNINILVNNDASKFLKNNINALSLFLVPSEPTHHAPYRNKISHTWLDLFIVRNSSQISSYSKSESPLIAGHDLIIIDYKLLKPKKEPSKFKTRNLKNSNHDEVASILNHKLQLIGDEFSVLKAELDRYEISPVVNIPEPINISELLSNVTDSFSNSLLHSVDTVAPLKEVFIKSKSKPWVSSNIRTLMNTRDKHYRIAKQSNLATDIDRYKFSRNRVISALSVAKNSYFAAKLRQAPDARAKWKELRKLGIASNKSSPPSRYFSIETLNQHYANVARKSPPLSLTDSVNICNRLLLNPNLPVFKFQDISIRDISMAILASKSKTFGHDQITPSMMKLVVGDITDPLKVIFNSSLRTGFYPETWKKTLVMPLLKKKTPESPSDTRPIARLSEVSKVLERIVHQQLISYLESNKLLDPRQSGFRAGHNTQTALLEVVEDIRLAIDQRKVTILVLFDFEKAFDSLPHSILLEKLRQLNCDDPVIHWFANYLCGRSQAVIDDEGIISEWLETFTGVPQGSVLGPLLFLIFINDLRQALRRCKHALFADDLQIYLHCYPDEVDEGLRQIRCEIDAVFNWAKTNGININLKKTKMMILGSSSFFSKSSKIDLLNINPIIINDVPIPIVSEAKNLGLILTPTLSWKEFVSATITKINGVLYSLRQSKHALSLSLKKYLVESLIFPHFDYICAVMSDNTEKLDTRLQWTMNACVRFVFGNIGLYDHVTPHRSALGWLSVKSRRQYFIIIQAYSVLARGTNQQLLSRFSLISNNLAVRRTDRLPKHSLVVPFARTEYYRRSFTVTASNLLNELMITEFEASKIYITKILVFNKLLDKDRCDWEDRVINERIECIRAIRLVPDCE